MKKSIDPDTESRPVGWFTWFASFALNALMLYVWCVFMGAAAGNANASARSPLLVSIAAGAFPLVGSFLYKLVGRGRASVVSAFATIPVVVAALFLFF